jgi:hypothetical protein
MATVAEGQLDDEVRGEGEEANNMNTKDLVRLPRSWNAKPSFSPRSVDRSNESAAIVKRFKKINAW